MSTNVSLYDNAQRALRAAKTVDEVREIHDRAEAARQYARRASNRQLEMDAAEIRVRAERRLGEMLIEMKNQKLIVRNGKANRKLGQFLQSDLKVPNSIIRQARVFGATPSEAFEGGLRRWREKYEGAVNIPLPLAALRDKAQYNPKFRRVARYKRVRDKAIDETDAYDSPRTIDQIKIGDLLYAHLQRCENEALKQTILMRLIQRRFANASSTALVRDLVAADQLKELDGQAEELVGSLILVLNNAIEECACALKARRNA